MESTEGFGAPRSSIRNLQPRSAAAMDFNDSDDDDLGDLLSADYKAQRKTTQDLVDFFKHASPPPSPPSLSPVIVDEKKKRTLLQRLRNRKSGSTMSNASSSSSGNRGNSRAGPRNMTSNNTGGFTAVKGGEVTTLPNGKKYIMIAVNYDDRNSVGLPAIAKRSSGSSSKRLSMHEVDSKHELILTNPTTQAKTMGHESGMSGNNHGASSGGDRRRSIIVQAGGGEGSSFALDNTPFMLDNFALDTDFMMPISTATTTTMITNDESRDGHQPSNTPVATPGTSTNGHRRTYSSKSAQSQHVLDNGSKRANKVKFSVTDTPQRQEPQGQEPQRYEPQREEPQQREKSQHPMDENTLSEALTRRIVRHKVDLDKNKGMMAASDSIGFISQKEDDMSNIKVELPKPVSRKKVRHVQIQTQHCIMRPVCTQTESMEPMARDLEIKEFGTQTMGSCNSISGLTECGTATECDSTVTSPISPTPTLTTATLSRVNSKVANLVASLSQTTTGTQASNPAPLTPSEQEELVQLRQQKAALQTHVATLQRDLAAEMRARTRTAVAMQDTREKFDLLSAMAYKKIKEMIFERHVLEMEVRELRSQVDMHTVEGRETYHMRRQQQQQPREYISVELR
ncbi:hypothetical protein BGX28_006268 [Mortierella sp. GBA30]|nr:hypothetical protein BGX28_006268 [Mortierella sp. GBA30]